MALATYLDLVNDVLVRMREQTVTDIDSDEYASLIGAFVNDAKRQVEDAHDWSANYDEVVVNLVAGQAKYSLTNSENRVKIDFIVNTSAPSDMFEISRRFIENRLLKNSDPNSRPTKWANCGTDANGDAVIAVHPTPAEAENLTVTGWFRQPNLSLITDELLIPRNPVFDLALAFAVRERGEVGGQTALEYFELAKRSLSDAIAYDAARNEDEDVWETI